MGPDAEFYAKFADSEAPGTPPLPPTPPKSIFKIHLKSDPEKTLEKSRKRAPEGPQTGPDGGPNLLNSAKRAFQNACEKKGARRAATEVARDPLLPPKCCSRLSGSVVFTFPLVAPKCSQMAPQGSLLGPFGPQNGPKVLARTLPKHNENSMRFSMPPGLQKTPK